MPSLGFLKKKRTKDSSGSRDLDSPTSPVKENALNKSLSNKHPFQQPSSSGSASAAPAAATTSTSQQDSSSGVASQPQGSTAQTKSADGSMTSTQAASRPYSPNQHNVPSIQNLLNNDRTANGGVPGTVQAPTTQVRTTKGKYTLQDFQIQRTLGTGSFGRVHLVQSKHNQRYYAIKVLKKAQVVKMKQVEHTNDERKMLQQVKHPFLITLWGTFQDSKNLYMVMDFIEGGELFSLLRKSQVGSNVVSLRYAPLIHSSASLIPSPNSTPQKSPLLSTISTQ
jgi:protein kinase A